MDKKTSIKSYKSPKEHDIDNNLINLFKNSPIPDEQLMENLGLFISSKDFSRMLFMNHIYKKILDIPGIVMDFGTRWGNNLALFSTFRSIYEPYNRHRKIIGFDTFSGFPIIDQKDGNSNLMSEGNVSTTKNYQDYLERIMSLKETQNPLDHIKKFQINVGDASKTVPKYLEENPHTVIALAYFDFDIYQPTKVCLNVIRKHLVKGSVLGFDELNDEDSPGETIALMETFGLNSINLRRLPITSRTSFFVVE